MATVVESGMNPVSMYHRFILGAEHEGTDAGRGDRTCLARLNSQARMRTGGNCLSLLR